MTSVLSRQPGDNGVTGRDVTMKAEIAAMQLRAKEARILAANHPPLGEARKGALTCGEQGWEPPAPDGRERGCDVMASSEVPPRGSETMYAFLLVLLK